MFDDVVREFGEHVVGGVGAFRALEQEMMGLGSEEEARLDRVDALVWALTDLLLTKRTMPRMFQV